MAGYRRLSEAVLAGDTFEVIKLASHLLRRGISPVEIVNKGLSAGMEEVGKKLKANEIFVADALNAANAMQAGLELIKSRRRHLKMIPAGIVVLGTVKGDIHDIGKNLVGLMLESGGFRVYDLGVDVEPQQFLEAVKEYQSQLLGLSAQLTTTMLNMKVTIEALERAGMRQQIKVIVGGTPVTREFAEEIGADGYAPDALAAVELCRQLIDGKTRCERKRRPKPPYLTLCD